MLLKIVAFFESVVLFLGTFVGSFFGVQDRETKALTERLGGFVCGVCHPNGDYELLREGGFNWVRFDVPYPFDRDGSVSGSYRAFRERAEAYRDEGFRVMAITPYPGSYREIGGLDVRDSGSYAGIRDVTRWLFNDLKDVCGAFQITNEMGVDAFTYPLTLEEAATFIGIQLQALYPIKGDFPVGYNSASLNEKLHALMQPYLQFCDYVGIDMYFGNTGKGNAWDYIGRVEKLHRITRLPVIVQEFGFLSEGKPKTAEEKAEILASYGYDSEEAAKADIDNFLAKLPDAFRLRLEQSYPNKEDWGDAIFGGMSGHFYREVPGKTYRGYSHTPEGQAQFYNDLLPKLKKLNCLAGMTVYCCQDGSVCWYCGQAGCPYETRWGLIDESGQPKPAFETVKKYFTQWGK